MISIISAFEVSIFRTHCIRICKVRIWFSLEDCSNGISLIMAVEQHPDVDVIVIGHTVVKDIETYLSQIREITKDSAYCTALEWQKTSVYTRAV